MNGHGSSAAASRLHLWLRRLAWLLFPIAALALLETALIAVYGGPWRWNRLLHAARPAPRLLAAALALLGWHLLRRGPRYDARAWAACAGRLFLGGLSALAAFFAAEIGLRLHLQRTQSGQSLERLDPARRPDPQARIRSSHPLAVIIRKSANPRVVYELQPGLDRPFGHNTLRTNSQGLRDSLEYPVARRPNSVRIVGIGDSGMFGWGCDQDQNYLDVLESNLNARADGVLYEVLNMAVPGYNTQLEVDAFFEKGARYRPDLVVVGWCDNDFQLPFFMVQEGQWDRRDVSFLWLLLFDRQRYADIALSRVVDQRSVQRERVSAFHKAGVDAAGVRQALTALKARGEREGYRVYAIGNMRPEAVQIFRELDIPFFNVRERIGKDEYPENFYLHSIHPRPGGHAVLAQRLEAELEALGWLKPAARPAPDAEKKLRR